MSELVVGSIAGLAANSYEVSVASGSTLDLANAKAGSLPDTALAFTPGLEHIHTETVSASSSVSFDNVFTSEYDNYRILIRGAGSGGANFLFRMRSSAADYTTNTYFGNIIYTTNSGGPTRVYNANQTSGVIGEMRDLGMSSSADVLGPALSGRTFVNTSANAAGSSDNIGVVHWYFINSDLQFDGITIYPAAHTFTGSIRIYGYRNS